jgi:serine/threonine protein kinase/tetratricopeptide (TPR) repeat protein
VSDRGERSSVLGAGHVLGGRFRLEALSQKGGMGSVFRAFDLDEERAVAVKVLDGTELESSMRFAREAELLATMRHPAIVRYVAHGIETLGIEGLPVTGNVTNSIAQARLPYLVMDWIEGETLGEVLKRGKIDLAPTLLLGTRIASALAYAHGRRLVHRDIKPGNIHLPTSSGGAPRFDKATLLDFGIARPTLVDSELTLHGMPVGTIGYMAPEQARGETEVRAAADVFALGCVLFACLVGKRPFTGNSLTAVLAKTLHEEAPRLRELVTGVPRGLDDLIARMLSKDPAERPTDGAEVIRELEKVEEEVDARTGDSMIPTGISSSRISAGITSREQVLVSVVLASTASFHTRDIQATMPGGVELSRKIERTQSQVEALGGRLERLANGLMVATVSGAGHATDLAAQAARVALVLQRALPDSRVALATGRGMLGSRLPIGDAIERAAKLVEEDNVVLERAPRDSDPPRPPPAVVIDESTAGLLDARFQVSARSDGMYLEGESVSLEHVRTLLGRPTRFVGRSREMGILTSVYDACIEEETAQAVILTGEAGVGKSRLRYEFLRHLRSKTGSGDLGVAPEIWSAQSDPMGAGAPLRLMAALLVQALGLQEGESTEGARQRIRARVARHVQPSQTARVSEFLGELVGVPNEEKMASSGSHLAASQTVPAISGNAALEMDPDGNPVQQPISVELRVVREDARVRGDQIRRAVIDFVGAECAHKPVVLVLEDLHWGDQPTVELVDTLLGHLRDAPLFVLAAGRPELHTLFPKLWSGHSITPVPLSSLSRKASETLVRTVLGQNTDEQTVERLTGHAGGNALFLEELIRASSERGPGSAELPGSLLAVLQSRLERLDPAARRALRAASIFGETFWMQGVGAVLGEESGEGHGSVRDVTWMLDHLSEQELVSRRPESRFAGAREYVFRHAHVRDAAYGTLTEEDRKTGHALAGEWLERQGERDALVLAEHFERGGEFDRATVAYRRAAEQSMEANDMRGALSRAEIAARAESPADRAAMRLFQAEAHRWLGEIGRAKERANEALALLRPHSDAWYEAIGIVAEAHGRVGDLDKLVELSELLLTDRRAGDSVPPPPSSPGHAVAAPVHVAMSGSRAIALVRATAQLLPAARTELVERLLAALAPQREAFARNAPNVAGWIEFIRGLRALYLGDVGDAIAFIAQGAEHFERAGDLRNACMQKVRLGYMLTLVGMYVPGEESLREALADAEAMGLRDTISLAKHNLGLSLFRLGRLEDAERYEGQALRDYVERGDLRLAGASHLYLAMILVELRRLEDAERHVRESIAMLAPTAPMYAEAMATLAYVFLAARRHDEALGAASEAYAAFDRVGESEDAEALILRVHAEALFVAGEKAQALVAVGRAKARLLERAAKIHDPSVRRHFLEEEHESRATLRLAEAWS